MELGKKDKFFKRLGAELFRNKQTTGRGATVFLGAGASIESMIMTWPEMAKEICLKMGLTTPNRNYSPPPLPSGVYCDSYFL